MKRSRVGVCLAVAATLFCWLSVVDTFSSAKAQELSPYIAMRLADDLLGGQDRDLSREHIRELRQQMETLSLPEALREPGDRFDDGSLANIYRRLGWLSILEGRFGVAQSFFSKSAEAFDKDPDDRTRTLDLRRAQAAALILDGRKQEGLALDQTTAFCGPGDQCDLRRTLQNCGRAVSGGPWRWAATIESLGPGSACAAEAFISAADIAEAESRLDLVEPFLSAAIAAAESGRYAPPGATDELLAIAKGRLASLGGLTSQTSCSRSEGCLGSAASQTGRPGTGRRRLSAADRARIAQALATNLEFFGRVAQRTAYKDSAPSRPFEGAGQLSSLSRTISKQYLALEDLPHAVEFSDLALHFASRAFAPHFALRMDMGAAGPQCPPGRASDPDCREWNGDEIAQYSNLAVADLFLDRARIEIALGNNDEAVRVAWFSEQITSNWLRRNWTKGGEAADAFDARRNDYSLLLADLGAVRDQGGRAAERALDLAFSIAQRMQINAVETAVRDASIRQSIEVPLVRASWQKRQFLVREREKLLRGTPAFARLSAEIASIEDRLPFSPSELESKTAVHVVTAIDARRHLLSSEALLVVLPLSDRTEVFLITAQTRRWITSPRSEVWLDERVDALRAHLGAEPEAKTAFDRAAAFEIFCALLGPLEMDIGSRRILLSGSGSLRRLPLTVLVTRAPEGENGDAAAMRSTHWLGQTNAIVVLPSIASLERRDGSLPIRRNRLVAFADPVVPEETLMPVEIRRGALDRLPLAGSEARSLQERLGKPSELFLRERSTEEAVKTADLTSVAVLAFATHALPATLHSEPGLVLTRTGVGEAGDDGFLTASEVASLSLGVDLVVLSACNTADASENGGESMTGLALAFLFAGGETVIATHWPVVDQAAARLMVDTVGSAKERSASGIADALMLAIRSVMSDASNPESADPRFWGPFVVIG